MSSPFRRAWRGLSSLRFGVALFVLLAVASLVGVMLPQPESFKFNDFRALRLTPGAERAMEPEEFVSLCAKAGILPDSEAFSTFVSRALGGKIADEEARESYERYLAGMEEDTRERSEKVFAILLYRAQQGFTTPEEWAPLFAEIVTRIGRETLEDDAWHAFLQVFGIRGSQGAAKIDTLRLAYVDSYGGFIGGWLAGLGVHHLFTSALFRILCGLLMVNLVACSLRRLPGQWRAAFPPAPPAEADWYRRRAIRSESETSAAPDAAAGTLTAALRAQGFHVQSRTDGDAVVLEATRGWLGMFGRLWSPLRRLAGSGRLGAQVVHVGVLLIAIGGFTSRRMSFRHPQVIGQGQVVAVPDVSYHESLVYHLRSAWRDLFGLQTDGEPTAEEKAANALDWREGVTAPPENPLFRLRLDDFQVRHNLHGKPEYFRSYMTVLDTDPPLTHTIEVNRPLIYRGMHAYQDSYQTGRGLKDVTLAVLEVERPEADAPGAHRERTATKIKRHAGVVAPVHEDVAVPDMPIRLRILRFFPHLQIPWSQDADGRRILGEAQNASDQFANPAIELRIESDGMEPQRRWVTLPFRPREPRQGGIADMGAYRIVPMEYTLKPIYSTVLVFKSHPVLALVWVGCGLMMAGICLCFYCNHERVCALVRPGPASGSQAFLSGSAYKWRRRFRERFDAVAASLDATDGGTQ
ncbi:cytochrome c biogenesis protein ResB [bacterium]|nr:cytochrome c biogenesis protein ResB [bacterium]